MGHQKVIWARGEKDLATVLAKAVTGVLAPIMSTLQAHRADYSGAIYGSLVAASVVVGAGSAGLVPARNLALLVLGTGLVFWVAHVYATLLGGRREHPLRSTRDTLLACREEWPLVQAAVPPAAVAFFWSLWGGSDSTAAWLALATAVTGQVGWAAVAARQLGYSWWTTAGTALVNLLLGLVIVALKAGVHH